MANGQVVAQRPNLREIVRVLAAFENRVEKVTWVVAKTKEAPQEFGHGVEAKSRKTCLTTNVVVDVLQEVVVVVSAMRGG